jgi:hypothetical protein
MVDEHNDLAMLQGKVVWPAWPYLPLKRSINSEPNTGLLANGCGPVVFLVNLFALTAGEVDLATAKMLKYPTYQAILDDSWFVD